MATGKETSTTAEEAAEKLADQELDATGGGPGIPLDRIINPNRYHFGCGLWVPTPDTSMTKGTIAFIAASSWTPARTLSIA
jgi:hypothetical protein